MTYDDKMIRQLLIREEQTHLLRFYEDLPKEEQNRLLSQIAGIDFEIFRRAERNEAKRRNEKIGPIEIFCAEEADRRRSELEAEGLDAIRKGKIGAVLLCGGQGSRLGFEHSKGMFDIGKTHPLYIFELHFSYMRRVAERAGSWFPIFIMTSELNDGEIKDFLREHDYFGYNGDFVYYYIQNMVPATDTEGKILMQNRSSLVMAPDGNGGWFSSLRSAGLLPEIHAKGIEWFNVVSIDNVLQRTVDPAFVGATLLSGAGCGAKVIRKCAPNEKIGLICCQDGHPTVIEYYELDELTRRGNVDLTGIEYGVILNYLFPLDGMERTENKPLPIHRAHKKIPCFDGEKFVYPDSENGYKYEMLATDLVGYMGSCLPYEVRREAEFAPVKNKTGTDSVDTARLMLHAAGYEL